MGIIKKWNDTGIRLRYSGQDEEGIKVKAKARDRERRKRERDDDIL